MCGFAGRGQAAGVFEKSTELQTAQWDVYRRQQHPLFRQAPLPSLLCTLFLEEVRQPQHLPSTQAPGVRDEAAQLIL